MKRLLLSSAAVAILAASPAFAADMPLKAPKAPTGISDWTGFYIGAHVGAAWSDINWDNVSLTGEPVTNSDTSWMAGGQAGFNYQVGTLVFGLDATISGTDLSGIYGSKVNPVVTYNSEIDWIATVTGRLGVAWDRILIYAKGGGAWARLTTSGRNPGIPDAFDIESTRSGWVAGGGMEFLVTGNFVFGFEYNHIDLGTHNRNGVTTFGFPFTIGNVDTTIDTVVMRASWKFGGPLIAKY